MKLSLVLLTSIILFCSCGNVKRSTDGSKEYNFYYLDGTLKKQKKEYIDSLGQNREYWTYYYKNGNISKEGFTNKNIAEAHWKFYYESGKIKSETEFRNDIRNGSTKYYWENGNIKGTGTYKMGELHGLWTAYYENGHKEREGEMISGKENGIWKMWTEEGALFVIGEYEMGTLINENYVVVVE